MEKYKLIMSYDIQDQHGNSVLKDNAANAIGLPMSETDFKNFSFTLARLRLEMFVAHLYTCSLQDFSQRSPGKNPQIKSYTYEIGYPRNLSGPWDYLHSEVTILGKGDPYSYLQEDAERYRASVPADLLAEYNQNSKLLLSKESPHQDPS